MKLNGILFIVLGVFILLGGITGYILKSSIPSLVSGLVFGPLLIISGKKTIDQALRFETVGLITTFFLDAFFTFRVFKTNQFIPAGLFVILSSVFIIIVCANIKKRVNRIPTE
jgi:uncharacterized membrane protein (UPF0136 family)